MDDDRNHPQYRRRLSVSLSALRRADELARSLEQGSATGDAGIHGTFDDSGPQISFGHAISPAIKGFWARITGQSGDMYSFQAVLGESSSSTAGEVVEATDTVYFSYPDGTFNAKEVNGNLAVPLDKIVWLVPSAVEDCWEFEHGPGDDGITVCDSAGNCVSGVTNITLPPGFTLTDNGGGSVTVGGGIFIVTNIFIQNNITYYTIQEVAYINNVWIIISETIYNAININLTIINIGTLVIIIGGQPTGGPGGGPIVFINQCCSADFPISGSGSGQGSGCCLCGMEGNTLLAQFSGGTGGCTCLNGISVTLNWVSCNEGWNGTAAVSCGANQTVCVGVSCTGQVSLGCSVAGGPTGGSLCVFSPGTVNSLSCSPFLITATSVPKFNCCTGAVNVTITQHP